MERAWIAALRRLDEHDDVLSGRTPTEAQRFQREALEREVREVELSLSAAPRCDTCGEYCFA